MPTKTYSIKYRQLKQVYEREVNKKIADITWQRVVSFLRQKFDFEVESPRAQKIVETFAGLKRRYGALAPASKGFDERWKAFKHFYRLDRTYTAESFLNTLADYLNIDLNDVPRSTKYYWFEKAGLSFGGVKTYHSKDLALVAFVATKWAINKRVAPMKSATEVFTLTK